MALTPKVATGNRSPEGEPRRSRTLGWRTAAQSAAEFVQHQEIQSLFDHWCSLWKSEEPPQRRDIDATEMPAALVHIFLMDYLAASRRLRFRLAGAEVDSNYEHALAGKHLDEIILPHAYPEVSEFYFACPERPAIVVLKGRIYDETEKPGLGAAMLLPLFDKNGGPGGLIGIFCCDSYFNDRAEARHSAERVIRTFPLDGQAPTEERA